MSRPDRSEAYGAIQPHQIPCEVVEAAARYLCAMDGPDPDSICYLRENGETPIRRWQKYTHHARAAIAAALNAWPGAAEHLTWPEEIVMELYLPFPQEK